MLKEILKNDNNKQYSINIDLDYHDEEKKQSYILTSKSIEIINEVISTFDNKGKNKSKILIGPYGKGKSHLALYMLGLVSDKNRTNEKYSLLIKKSEEQGKEVLENIKNFIDSNQKYLPVILNSTPYNKKFSDILVYSLKNALDRNGIKDINLDFYFEKAIAKINIWEKQYINVFNQLQESLDEDIYIFKEKLKLYDKNAYDKFKSIYKNIMAGEEFNPYFEINPIDIYRETSIKLKEHGYKGIFVLYDEFSKYIEYLLSQNSLIDVKEMQEFAEFCNRTQDQEVHMLLISHKSIGQYTDQESKSNIDAWKAIEGRFDEIQYNDFSNQQYEIISSAIRKDNDLWNRFKNDNKERFNELKNNNFIRGLFKELSDKEYEDWIVYGSYPMHPLATYALPRISERVAQNERTLFSFLCKNESNTLYDYIQRNNSEVKLGVIYDYFEDNISSLGYADEINKILIKSNKVIEQLDDDLKINIVKSIAIIHMINNFNIIRPNYSVINVLYGDNSHKALKELIDDHYLIYKQLNDVLEISTDKDIEVLTEIKNMKENNSNIDIIEFLNNHFKNNFIESRRYNDENHIVRYFKVKFANENINSNYIREDIKQEDGDGLVYIVQNKLDCIDEDLNVLFIENNIDKNIEETIKYLNAIKKIKLSKNTELSIKKELNILEANYENIIKNYIRDIISLNFNNRVIYKNQETNITTKKQLSNKISDIMDRIFFNTPIINNEMINKSQPSRVVIGARKKIIDQIIQLNENQSIEFKKGSLESTILRSTLLLNGAILASENEGEYKLNYSVLKSQSENNLINLLKEVDCKIKQSADEDINMREIYNIFESERFGYGMKRGPIPIYVAFIFRKYKKYLSISENSREIVINANTIESIDLNPDNYTIKLQKMNIEREEYIENLECIFADNISTQEKVEDSLTYLTLGIKRWFLYLSKYTKDSKKIYLGNGESKKIPKNIIKFKNRLRVLNENSIRFLFEDMVEIFEVGSYSKLVEIIQLSKNKIDNYELNLYKSVESDIRSIFKLNENISINNGLDQWLESIDKSIAFKNGFIGGFIKLIEDNKDLNDSKSYLNKISSYILGLYVSDWNDDTPSVFLDKLNKLIKEIEELSLEVEENDNKQILLEMAIGSEDVNLGTRASMLLDDLKDTLDDYGSSVTEKEKRAILIELLKEIN